MFSTCRYIGCAPNPTDCDALCTLHHTRGSKPCLSCKICAQTPDLARSRSEERMGSACGHFFYIWQLLQGRNPSDNIGVTNTPELGRISSATECVNRPVRKDNQGHVIVGCDSTALSARHGILAIQDQDGLQMIGTDDGI